MIDSETAQVLPALPAGIFGAEGHTLLPAELAGRVIQLGADSPEAAHGAQDHTMRAALDLIRDGHPDPVGIATGALLVADADYSRWDQ